MRFIIPSTLQSLHAAPPHVEYWIDLHDEDSFPQGKAVVIVGRREDVSNGTAALMNKLPAPSKPVAIISQWSHTPSMRATPPLQSLDCLLQFANAHAAAWAIIKHNPKEQSLASSQSRKALDRAKYRHQATDGNWWYAFEVHSLEDV
jgi:hypothetical protein